jgi:WD40 repeat protein
VCLQNGGLISGGAEGEIRVWSIDPTVQRMKTNLKEHRSLVSCIILSQDDKRAVSVSTDGSCIVWDLENYARLGCMFEKTMFKQVVFNREEFQVVTTGSARNIS